MVLINTWHYTIYVKVITLSSLLKVVEYSHMMIQRYADKEGIAVDMTLGNGNDTLLLTQYFKQVYAFDIQEQAIQVSSLLLQDKTNYQLILDDHINIDKYVKKDISLAIYNLGYLPKADETIVTNATSTIQSLKKVLSLLKRKGLVIIVVYHGHDVKKEEALALSEFISQLEGVCYHISKYEILNHKDAPYVYCIHKK